MLSLLNIVVDATIITLILALAASGLALIYGLLGVINLGHGAMLTMGAYFCWHATTNGVPFVVAVVLAAIGVSIIGVLFEHVVVRHFYGREFDTMLITWGFFLVVSECLKLYYGTQILGVANPMPGAWSLGGLDVPTYRATIALFSIVLVGFFALLLYRTDVGLRIRAVTQNGEMAQMLGVNTNLLYKGTFMAGAFMAGLAGALLCPLLSIDPYIGNVYLVRSFFVVIVGGVGQILGGTLVGSFVIGGLETVTSTFTSQTIAQVSVFVVAAVLIRFRPAGVFKS